MGKQYTTAPILVNSNGDPIPQYLDITDKTDSPQGTFKPLTNETIQKVQLTGSDASQPLPVNVVNQADQNTWVLAEQRTEADAIGGVVTFQKEISKISIYNGSNENGVFIVNGMTITIPPITSWFGIISGNQSKQISISGSTSYIISRYE